MARPLLAAAAAAVLGLTGGLVAHSVPGLLIVGIALGAFLAMAVLVVVRGRMDELIRLEIDGILFAGPYAFLGAGSAAEPLWFAIRVMAVWAIGAFLAAWFVMISRMIARPVGGAERRPESSRSSV